MLSSLSSSLGHDLASLTGWGDLVLSTSRRRRYSLKLWVVSFGSYLLYAALLALQIGLGFAKATPVAIFLVCVMVVNLGFYAMIRSGLVERRGAEATIGAAQLLFGMMAMWANYAMVGPAAPATTIIIASHIVYASFSMTSTQVRLLTTVSLGGLASVMMLCRLWQPERYPTDIQLVAFLYALLVIPLTAVLARSVTTMQRKLRERSHELRVALAQVQELATRDEVTGLYNRRHMTGLLSDLMTAQTDSGAPLSIALLDLDLFKSINDRFGHAVGDAVLRRFAQVTQQSLRDHDVIARWGGEEFLVTFPGTTVDAAEQILGRVRTTVGDLDLDDIEPGFTITFSAGLTPVIAGERAEDVLERADQAMYRAKTAGRDRILRDDAEVVTQPITAPRSAPPLLGLDG